MLVTPLAKMTKTNMILPVAVCRDYNTPLWCPLGDQCSRLHVCKYFVYGRCLRGKDCSRAHILPKTVIQNNNECDLQKSLEEAKLPEGIPTPRRTIVAKPLRWIGRTRVHFDLETTGFGADPHIVQIAATTGYQQFMRFVKPHKPIDRQAQKVTGFRFKDGKLYRHGQVLPAVSVFTALSHFINWLSKFDNPILIAHNAKLFDGRLLVSGLKATKMIDRFNNVVVGFLDSLTLTKEVLPRLRKYTLENVYKYFMHESYPSHDAMFDSTAVEVIMNHMDPPYEVMLRHSFDTVYLNLANRSLRFRKIAEESLLPIVKAGHMSKAMSLRTASSGLDYNSLKYAYQNKILQKTLSYNIDGRIRVTGNEEIIQKLEDYFELHVSDE